MTEAGTASDVPHGELRQRFKDELASLEAHTLGALDLVTTQLDRSLEALEPQDVELLDGRFLQVHQGILSPLALQAPAAGDRRPVAALLHTIKHIERMGDQC